jgi:hypothetical protein
MTPERIAGLVLRWARLYTRGLPRALAERRVAELRADLHDHVEHERARGTGERRIALAIASRLIRGLGADLAAGLPRPVVRVAVGVAAVLALPAVGMLLSDGVVWSAADFVLAGVLLATVGAAFELAARRGGSRLFASGICALGVVAALLGAADDAPGLVLLGLLLVAGGLAVARRRAA